MPGYGSSSSKRHARARSVWEVPGVATHYRHLWNRVVSWIETFACSPHFLRTVASGSFCFHNQYQWRSPMVWSGLSVWSGLYSFRCRQLLILPSLVLYLLLSVESVHQSRHVCHVRYEGLPVEILPLFGIVKE